MTNFDTTEKFIYSAQQVHGGIYDYSQVDYQDNEIPVRIICPIHDVFTLTPTNHLDGWGCPVCRTLQEERRIRRITAEFVAKAKLVHGNRYRYAKTQYKSSGKKVEILCPTHGPFFQTPYQHLRGRGCIKCGRQRAALKNRMGKEKFIQKANSVHGDRYNYSQVEYRNNTTDITIICPIHGSFQIKPASHLNGIGCRICFPPNKRGRKPIPKAEIFREKPLTPFPASSHLQTSGKYKGDSAPVEYGKENREVEKSDHLQISGKHEGDSAPAVEYGKENRDIERPEKPKESAAETLPLSSPQPYKEEPVLIEYGNKTKEPESLELSVELVANTLPQSTSLQSVEESISIEHGEEKKEVGKWENAVAFFHRARNATVKWAKSFLLS